MTSRLATFLALIAVISSCTLGGSSAPSEQLASDQTLSFPISQDVADFDPAQITSPADVDILRNVFSGLYRFDDQLHEVPDIATAFPDISADGLTYTFHLRKNARFSNGDAITADDVVYSWNRAAARQGEFATLFSPIKGYDAVARGRTKTLSGLSATDPYTVQTQLSKAAGYWLTEVGLWPFWLVDQKVVKSAGEDLWYAQPETLVGSGPFKMTARQVGATMDFEPVAGWYGGTTGKLKHVHVEVLTDPVVQISKYESGVFSLIGYGRQTLEPATAARYLSDQKLRGQLNVVPAGVTFWVGFNLKSGPFAGDAGKAGRHAFSTAIDRAALVQAVCTGGTTCIEATGGLISKGLAGYLGDGADVNAKFNAAAAKSEYQSWDPNGSKVKNLSYTYDSGAFNAAVCTNLASQWKQNLGVTVKCTEVDRQTFFDTRDGRCGYNAFRESWSADYNSPQDWFDYLFVSRGTSNGACYSNAAFDKLASDADAQPAGLAIAGYEDAGKALVDGVAYAALVYGVQQYLVQPYVRGAGGTALYDFYWTSARIDQH
ncbi:MAG TPA: peptide ABC transporter substrate-binding protein [Candidatus Dormibacteraeota bacterium]|nr:peptide ABC transporter substrate-binding protein [Candidatus Dormibacteraeota bacterium]